MAVHPDAALESVHELRLPLLQPHKMVIDRARFPCIEAYFQPGLPNKTAAPNQAATTMSWSVALAAVRDRRTGGSYD
jgi:hypothetical protein